jgi:hypothetical protein
MFQASRHFPLYSMAWNEGEVRAAIGEIAQDALSAFDPATLWPAHPMDNGAADEATCLYLGAAGCVWALDYLGRVGFVTEERDFAPVLATALNRNARWYKETPYSGHASLLMGELGIRLVSMRVSPSARLADEILKLAARNSNLPIVELMWGLPGSMLACIHMDAMIGDPRFQALFQTQADRLLAELEIVEEGPIWTQDLYGHRQRYLGAVHGFAGNMLPLVRGWAWLTPDQRSIISDAVPRTLAAHQIQSKLGVNWPAVVPGNGQVALCQHCHGAPGIVTTFADAPFSSPGFESLLLKGGDLIWIAGALSKGPNLCHGTGGNGYALLKLYRRTGEPRWLERARAFAMTAVAQVRGARAAFGRGRYSLWTGDLGIAIYLWHCITGDPSFPSIDVL